MQIRDYINTLAQRMVDADLTYAHGTASAFDEAVYLVYCTLDISFSESVEDQTGVLDEKSHLQLEALARQRLEDHVPVAYLVGKAWFAGHEFYCDHRALIPRSPIAELIANDFQPMLSSAPTRILDLCTGSGCIGIACALAFQESQVSLSDISADCLALARRNIELHGLQDRVTTHESDLFAGLSGRFDLIVSNPPYVGADEVAALPPEFGHEPALGLLSDDDGLAIPLAILRSAADYLSESGLLVMEVGYSAERLQARLAGVPLLWLEFEEGGEGVFAISRKQLQQFSDRFN